MLCPNFISKQLSGKRFYLLNFGDENGSKFVAASLTTNAVNKCKEHPAVINATYAVAKRKPEKIRLAGIRILTSAIPVQRSNQLSYQANWELVIKLVRNIPGKDEDEIMNI